MKVHSGRRWGGSRRRRRWVGRAHAGRIRGRRRGGEAGHTRAEAWRASGSSQGGCRANGGGGWRGRSLAACLTRRRRTRLGGVDQRRVRPPAEIDMGDLPGGASGSGRRGARERKGAAAAQGVETLGGGGSKGRAPRKKMLCYQIRE
jgi:hypothetical protein